MSPYASFFVVRGCNMEKIVTTEYLAKMDNLMPLIRETLDAGKSVAFSPRGVSMKPMLRQGIDSVVLSPLHGKLRKYDIPLYRYPSGKYILHRIVDVKEDHYICLGDNTYTYETVQPDYLIAVVTAFKRGDKTISVQSPVYRLYCRLWVGAYPLRKFAKRAIGWIRRHLK